MFRYHFPDHFFGRIDYNLLWIIIEYYSKNVQKDIS